MGVKPTSVIVLSIIGIVIAALNLLGIILLFVIMFAHLLPTSPSTTALEADPLYAVIKVVSTTIGTGNNLLLLFSSIASLRLIRWARKAMLAYAWIALAHMALGLILNCIYVFPKMLSSISSAPSSLHASIIGGMIGTVCGVFLFAIFPICILRFFTRKKVIDAFNGILPAAQSNFQVLLPGE